jgi:hypothetical protein
MSLEEAKATIGLYSGRGKVKTLPETLPLKDANER